MRVAISLLGLPTIRQGGAGFYAATLIRALAAGGRAEPLVLSSAAVGEELRGAQPPVRVRTVGAARRSRAGKAVELVGSLRRPERYRDGFQPVAPSELAGCDLVHYPLSFFTQPSHSLPRVVTCMDLQHLELPRFFSRRDRLIRRARWHRAVRTADRVIAASEYTKRAVIERLEVPEDRVDVVYLSCHERFFDGPPPPPPPGAPGEFIFYPASPLPAKNHERLLRAFARVATRLPNLSLVLSGPALHDWSRVRAVTRAESLDGRVVIAGHLELEELRSHYAHARALIFPSLFEGFGLPLLEAMASGCPVAASNATSIPEVVGEAGLAFDPRDEEDIADAIERSVALPESERSLMAISGRERAQRFRLPQMVDGTVDVYRRAVDGR